MFLGFFYLLRACGLMVSLNEWMTLMEALEAGLAGSSFTGFYYLCRSVLVKSETDFDKFDSAFLQFFKDINLGQDIPKELLAWLSKPNEVKDNYDEDIANKNAMLRYDEIMKMLEERLKEQDSEHNGGSYWVGTGGMSVFGNNGNSPKGIRVGGESKHKRAFEVAGERHFRDFRNDSILDTRQFQVAFRSLRQFTSKLDAPKTQLDLDESIDETCNNAGNLKLVYARPRQNTVKVLMLIDSGGSMDYYSHLCGSLFQAARKSNHFKDLKIYYFHNCVYSKLYTDPTCMPGKWIDTETVLHTLGSDYKVIIIGDAAMAPYELMDKYNYSYGIRGDMSGLEWFRRIKSRFSHIVWLNPTSENNYWGDYWQQTHETLANEFDMYALTVSNLERALKKLVSSR